MRQNMLLSKNDKPQSFINLILVIICLNMDHSLNQILLEQQATFVMGKVKRPGDTPTMKMIPGLRELLQFGTAPRRYFFSLENWLEVTLIALIALLLFMGGYGCHVSAKRHMAAIVIVLSW